jgi:hypothetical protein
MESKLPKQLTTASWHRAQAVILHEGIFRNFFFYRTARAEIVKT